MEIVPLDPGFAAELRGVTLSDVAACTAGRAGFEEHSVLVLREPAVLLPVFDRGQLLVLQTADASAHIHQPAMGEML